MKITIVCYGNQRSAGIAEVVRQEARIKGLKIEVDDGGIPEWTKEGSRFNPAYLDKFNLIYPAVSQSLRARARKPLTNKALQVDRILTMDSYLQSYLAENLSVPKEKIERVLDFAKLEGVNNGEMDDAEYCHEKKRAQYVEKRVILPEERFFYKTLHGERYLEGSPEAYGALAVNCVEIGKAIAKRIEGEQR